MSAREEILGRVRSALAGTAAVPQASGDSYRRKGTLDPAARLELLLDRLADYDATVVRVAAAEEIAAALGAELAAAGEQRVVVAAEFPAAWLPEGLDLLRDAAGDGALSIAEIERAQAVVTTCEVAVASSGTLVLVHEGAQARRVLTLLPDHHLCVLRTDQIVELLPEAMERLRGRERLPMTTISGPSATSDIEMTRIRGVHGPRRLTVVVLG